MPRIIGLSQLTMINPCLALLKPGLFLQFSRFMSNSVFIKANMEVGKDNRSATNFNEEFRFSTFIMKVIRQRGQVAIKLW